MYQKLQVGRARVVTPSDTNDILSPGATAASGSQAKPTGCVLYVGVAGDLKVETIGGDVVTFVGVVAGSFIPVQVRKVYSTDTSAQSILALW